MADKTLTRALVIRGRLGRVRRVGGGVRASVYLQIRPSRKRLYHLSGTFTHATRPLPLSIKENITAIHFGVSMAYKHDRKKNPDS